jgi:FkbM family methyltransferase
MMGTNGGKKTLVAFDIRLRAAKLQSMRNIEIFPYRDGSIAFRRDDWMLQNIVHGGAYEPYVIEAFLETLTPKSRVLDLGANVGAFTIPAARRCEHVYAVEMVPENAKLVAINAQLNGLDNVTVWPCAVAGTMQGLTFPVLEASNNTVSPTALSLENEQATHFVLGLPIDLLAGIAKPDVIKMDVEGFETEALRRAIYVWDSRPIWFLEFSDSHQRSVSRASGEELLSLFFSRGYQATILHRDMTRENVFQLVDVLMQRWREYSSRNITHLDLMMVAPKLSWLRPRTRLRRALGLRT